MSKVQSKPVVWVPISSQTEYLHRILQGIARYRNQHRDWALHYPPNPFPKQIPPEVVGVLVWHAKTRQRLKLAGQIPCVQMSNSNPVPGIPLVSSDDRMAGSLAADHFTGRRLKSFAFLGPFQTTYTRMRYEGFQQRLKEINPDHRLEKFDFSSQRKMIESGGVEHLFKTLRTLPLPWALFCADDWWAKSILAQCPAFSVSVPGELSVLGVNNEAHVCEISDTPVSSIDVPAEDIGYQAAQLLDRMIHGEEEVPMFTRVPVLRVMNRQSTDIIAVSDPVVSKALSYMQAQLSEGGLTVGDIALASGVSRRVLERRFARELNVSPYQRLLRFRVDQAKSLLRATRWPLHRIAMECGFAEQKYLSVRFKKLEGLSPLPWRKAQTP